MRLLEVVSMADSHLHFLGEPSSEELVLCPELGDELLVLADGPLGTLRICLLVSIWGTIQLDVQS